MSESLLDKLKNKPIPKKIDEIEVKIQPKKDVDIEIKTKIVDKTKENKINRSKFLSTIKKEVSSVLPEKSEFNIQIEDREIKKHLKFQVNQQR